MGYRIEIQKSDGATVLQVAGILGGRGLSELEKLCRESLGPLCLDLANLQSVDAEGIRLIQQLELQGVALLGASPYLRLLLKQEKHPEES